MSNQPLVAVITINYNHADDSIKCIQSILESTYKNYLLFAVDNGSNENDFEMLNNFSCVSEKIKLNRLQENKGYVGGVNFGLKIASEFDPEYYLIMNNDTLIDKNAIVELVHTAQNHNNNCIVSGKVYNMDEPDTLQYIGQWCRSHKKLDYPSYVKGGREKDTGKYENEMEMGMLDDIFWLFSKDVFQKVGYYSTYFFLYGEQNDYALRAISNGVKLIYTPNAKIWHYQHLTTASGQKKSQKIEYWESYASLILVFLHLKKLDFLKYYLYNLLKTLTKGLLCSLNSKKLEKLKPKLFAYLFFTKWLFHKAPNTGFNPFNK